jgi:hypothetical protein
MNLAAEAGFDRIASQIRGRHSCKNPEQNLPSLANNLTSPGKLS